MNLAKFRKAQGEAEEAEKRANLAEQAMGKLRARTVMRSETPVCKIQFLTLFNFNMVLFCSTKWLVLFHKLQGCFLNGEEKSAQL